MCCIEDVCEKYRIKQDQIYIVGHSWGARGVWDICLEYPDFFVGAVAISGVSCPLIGEKLRNLPTFIAHSKEDNVVPVYHAIHMHQSIIKHKDDPIHKIFITKEGNHGDLLGIISHAPVFKFLEQCNVSICSNTN